VLYYSGCVSHFYGFALPNLQISQVAHTPGEGGATGGASSLFRTMPQVLQDTAADSYCIHYLKLTASIVPRQLAYSCHVTYYQCQLKGAAVREQLSVEGSSCGQQEDQSIHNLLTKLVSENCLSRCTMAVLIL